MEKEFTNFFFFLFNCQSLHVGMYHNIKNLLFCSNIVSMFYLKNSRMVGILPNMLLEQHCIQIRIRSIKEIFSSVFAKHPDEKLKDCQLYRCSKYPDVMQRRYLATNETFFFHPYGSFQFQFCIKLQNNGNYKHILFFKNKSRTKCKNTGFMFLFCTSAVVN